MFRTALQTACRRLASEHVALRAPRKQGVRCLTSRPIKSPSTFSGTLQNLSPIVVPKSVSQCLIIRNKTSDAVNSGASAAHDRIDKMIKGSKKRAFLFMKGVPEQPQCGYSNAVVQILDAYGVDYDSFDVLSDEEVRKEIKTYSNWPTIPQLYVDKTFVGGCDILIQMHQDKELEKLFKSKPGA